MYHSIDFYLDAIKELVKYVDKFMKVYLTDKKAQEIKAELDLVNGLMNIIDWELLDIDIQTRNFINQREELRNRKTICSNRFNERRTKEKFYF